MQSLSVEEYRATMTEAQFEAVVIELAGYLGYECFHVHHARRFWPGWPDWIAFRVGDDGLAGISGSSSSVEGEEAPGRINSLWQEPHPGGRAASATPGGRTTGLSLKRS